MNKIYLTLLFVCTCLSLSAQDSGGAAAATPRNGAFIGTVVDFSTGMPVMGASVIIVGTQQGAVTDKSGNFSIPVTGSATRQIEVSFVGYEKQTVNAEPGARVTVRLREMTRAMDEVIVIAYGTTTRRDLTGSVGKADMESLRKAPVANFEHALAGRVAGLQISATDGQPGNDMQIVIRGGNSITQDNSPLYVIDGFPFEDNVGNMLNPDDIESIEVLKDASSTAIYGARGANGVIMITTKKGTSSTPTVNYNGYVGVQNVLKTQDLLDSYEFVKYLLEMNESYYIPYYLKNGRTLEDYRNIKGIDWQDEVLRSALTHNHNISIRGRSDRTSYSITGLISDQDGVIINTGFKKYQGRLNLEQGLGKKTRIGLNLNYASTKRYGMTVAEPQSSPTSSYMYTVWGYRPVTGNDNDDLLGELFDPDLDMNSDYRVNPYLAAKNESNNIIVNTFIANGYFEYDIIKGLKLKINGGYTKSTQKREVFFNSMSRLGHARSNSGQNGQIEIIDRTTFLNENILTYNVPMPSGHRLDFLGGITEELTKRHSDLVKAIQVPNETLGIAGLREGTVTNLDTRRGENSLVSVIGRVNYNYRSKYLLTFSFRADASSKFPKKNRWGYFPSGAVAWGIGEEDFMKNLRFISSAKIRTSFGATGNNRVPDYPYPELGINSDSGYGIANSPMQGAVPIGMGNGDLKWETTVQTDVGLDIGFLDERIRLTTDFYYKTTKDLLLNATIAPSMGYLSAYMNIGKVSNRGLEITLDTRNVQTKDFSWTSNFNISFNRNRVMALNNDEPSLASRITWGNFNNAFPYIAIPGKPVAMFYGYIFDGVYQYDDFDGGEGNYTLKPGVPNNGGDRSRIQPGDIKYRDINGDGVVDEKDLTIIGNPNPKHIGGFNNSFQYKDWDLNVFFQWSYGGDIMNTNRIEFEGGDPTNRNFLNMFSTFADRWTPENQTNKLYRVGGQGPAAYSSRTVEDGSYLRLKTVSLGYRIPHRIVEKMKISSLRVYASAQNLVTWTKYTGLDPEVSTHHSALTPAFDWSAYPAARTLIFGVDITF